MVPYEVAALYVSGLPKEKRRLAEMVQRLAPRFAVDPRLALALSPRKAQGLLQLIPETAERFGVRDVGSAEQSARGGLAYLRWLLVRFGGDVALVSAAYNAGENAWRSTAACPPMGKPASTCGAFSPSTAPRDMNGRRH